MFTLSFHIYLGADCNLPCFTYARIPWMNFRNPFCAIKPKLLQKLCPAALVASFESLDEVRSNAKLTPARLQTHLSYHCFNFLYAEIGKLINIVISSIFDKCFCFLFEVNSEVTRWLHALKQLKSQNGREGF